MILTELRPALFISASYQRDVASRLSSRRRVIWRFSEQLSSNAVSIGAVS